MPFNGPVIPFAAMVECHLISAKDITRIHQFGPNVFLGHASYAGETGKESLWSQSLKNWSRWTHHER